MLDADDIWLPYKLAEQVAILEAHPEVGSLYGETLYWFSWTGRQEDRDRDYTAPLGFPPDKILDPPSALVGHLEGTAAVPCPCSLIVRRSVVLATGGFEEDFPTLYEDQVFFAKVFLEAPVFVAGECWDRYRRHDDSTWALGDRRGIDEAWRLKYLHWLGSHLTARENVDPDLHRALDRAMWPYRHPVHHWVVQLYQRIAEALRAFFWGRAVPMTFRISRLVLPAGMRERLWARWQRRA